MSSAAKFFGLSAIALEVDLKSLEKSLDISIKPERKKSRHDGYYPQVPEKIRHEARLMAEHYELFYCLEISIRDFIRAQLEATGSDWWEKKIPQVVRENAEKNKKKESATGITPRSEDNLAYINFGELGEIIKSNSDVFGQSFKDLRAVEAVISRLNTLRAPIAHCSLLADDEVLRLQLSLRDWFRLME